MKGRALVAFNLRRLRLRAGISQEALAADAEIDRAYVSELERKKANPSVDLLQRLADTLRVQLIEFFKEPTAEGRALAPLRVGRPRARH